MGDLIGRGTAVDKTADRLARRGHGAPSAATATTAAVLRAALPVGPRAGAPCSAAPWSWCPRWSSRSTLKKDEIPDNLFENFWEVANIMASLLNRKGVAHVALAERPVGWDRDGEDVRALLASPVRQRWFSITVPGYGTGTLGFVAAT